jgi:DNA-binding LytR/AlgR family response regulator
MKIKVLIVEDEALIAAEIAECLEENDFEITGIASTAEDALGLLLTGKPDVILMDISIKGKTNGIELAKRILESHNLPVIFLTSNTDTTVFKKATQVNPNAFLLKPFNEKELPIAIELAFTNHNAQVIKSLSNKPVLTSSVFVKNGKKFCKIQTDDIWYIQGEGSYSRLVTREGEFLVSFNLSQFHDEIDNKYFVRVHRSYIINLKNIDGFDLDNVFIKSKSIPISKQQSENFFKKVKKL